MFSTVLIPSDLSPASDQVIGALGIRHLEGMAPAMADAVQPRLAEQARALSQFGLPVTVELAHGAAHREIRRVARERGATLVLLGSQGAGLASELRVGSVTLETLHGCEVPVLLVRVSGKEGGEATCRALGRRVLHPTDFSDGAERAFAYVRALVRQGVMGVSLLHVQDRRHPHGHSEERLAEFDEIDRARLDRLSNELKVAGAPYVHTEVAHGSPIQVILRRAKEAADCLVVMGTQGRGIIPEVLLGSVSHAVARNANAPVLLVPARPGAAPRA